MRQIENIGIGQAKKLSLGFLSILPLQSQGCTSSRVRVGNQLFVAAEFSSSQWHTAFQKKREVESKLKIPF